MILLFISTVKDVNIAHFQNQFFVGLRMILIIFHIILQVVSDSYVFLFLSFLVVALYSLYLVNLLKQAGLLLIKH